MSVVRTLPPVSDEDLPPRMRLAEQKCGALPNTEVRGSVPVSGVLFADKLGR